MAEQSGWMSTSGPGPTAANPVSDQGKPQVARMYDYYLGGKDHFEADRQAASETMRLWPNVASGARANRHFLHVAVEHLAREQGIDQFIDIGTGIPTEPNTHQIAQYHQPQARVLYTDNDPIVMTYAQALLTSSPQGRVDYIEADLRKPQHILNHPCLAGSEPVLDLSRPVALFVVAIFHFITDEDGPSELLRTLLEPLAPGSHLVLSHASGDYDEDVEKAADFYRSRNLPARTRSREEVEELVTGAGVELVEPGVQPLHRWWPGRPARLAPAAVSTDAQCPGYGVMARKR